jgi:hypothetical protein
MFQQEVRVRGTRDVVFPAPTKGWVQSGNITTAGMDQAEVLDNFFPTAQGARLRGGSSSYADIGAAVVRMMVYSSNTDTLFASTASGIYDAGRINGGGAAFADVYGLSGGDWSVTQISTSGGQFMVAVNGVDPAHYYNGSDWYPIVASAISNVGYDALTSAFAVGEVVTCTPHGETATIVSIVQDSATAGTLRVINVTAGGFHDNEAISSASGAATANGDSVAGSAVTITGVTTSTLNQVWLYKTRLFFTEKDSQSVWYLPVASIGGAAVEIPLGQIFRKGGNVLFGATWSLDSGSGIDDVCVFVSTNGEIAVYEGNDPSSAADWALRGVYEISRPLNKHSYFKAGGDLAILTEDGIIPISEALQKDRAALQAVAITYPIEDAWKAAIANRTTDFPITPTLWQSQALLMIGVPGGASGVTYVANARTGAWCRYTGWDVRCGAVASDRLYFGTNAGLVMLGQDGGSDAGVAYSGYYVPKFTDGGNTGYKVANHAGLTVKSNVSPAFRMAAFSNYAIGTYPTADPLRAESADTWGSGVWGTFVWGPGSAEYAFTVWKVVRASGFSLSPAVVVTSNQTTLPAFEILATRLRYEVSNAI